MADVNPFVEFVAARLNLPMSKLPDASKLNDAGNTFGAISVRLGLLDVFDIDKVIEMQREHKQLRFGEIAVKLGLMTDTQVARALDVQFFYRSFEHGILLVLDGHLDLPRLIGYWGEFAASKKG